MSVFFLPFGKNDLKLSKNLITSLYREKILKEKHHKNTLPVHQRERPEIGGKNSPIHLAAARGNLDAVRILMESNVTKNQEPINKEYFILFEKLA